MGKWHLLKSDTVLSNPWLSVLENRYEVSEGEVIDDYYILERSNFALVVALSDDKLIMVRQYRPATDRSYLALPGGFLEDGETPEAAARRELLEETGFLANNCTLIGELHAFPAFLRSTAFIVLCEASPSGAGIVDRSEIDEVVTAEWEEVLQLILRGEINEMQAVGAILLAKEVLASPDTASLKGIGASQRP